MFNIKPQKEKLIREGQEFAKPCELSQQVGHPLQSTFLMEMAQDDDECPWTSRNSMDDDLTQDKRSSECA